MKKISIGHFNGNKDAYYNYKRGVEVALKSALEASRHASSFDFPLMVIDLAISELAMIEFVD